MEYSKPVTTDLSLEDEELTQECQQLMLSLPTVDFGGILICQYQGFWYPRMLIQPIISFQRHFQAQDTDIIVASMPKTGTTWLKALVFAITNRALYKNASQTHPLLTSNPHDLVPYFEFLLYARNSRPDLHKMDTPRLFSTHLSYKSLPESIKKSNSRVVYICRNPYDTFVSSFHFLSSTPHATKNLPVEEILRKLFDMVCEGVALFGPFFEHALGYWKESLERPENVLFLKYEDMKEDIVSELKKLAKFLGVPFSAEEEKEGVIEEITKLCSFENLRDLDVNKTGEFATPHLNFENNLFFRKGQVGDWVHYFTPSMVKRLEKLMQEKLGDSGLTFKFSLEK